MAIIKEQEIRKESVIDVAKKMLIAARTAPKARGIDNLIIALAKGEDIKIISDKMKRIGKTTKTPFIIRDAENILSSQVIVLIGTKIRALELDNCELCGFKSCKEKKEHPDVPCAFNTGDLGIAIGSAVNIAAYNHIDNRVMHSVGKAVVELGLLGKDVKIAFGIPLSVSNKNPFFDRK